MAELATALERLLDRRCRRIVLVGHIALAGATLEQLRALSRGQSISESQCPCVLRRRLAVRAERRRFGTCRGCETKHRVDVAGRLGVVREPGQIERSARWVDERRECPAMQVDPCVRAKRFLNGETGELVPERHASWLGRKHAGGQALVETVDCLAGERLQEPELRLRRHDGDRLEDRPSGGAEACGACEHCFPDRLRNPVGSRGERFDDEERVAGRLAVELVRVNAVRLGELRDRPRREQDEFHPPDVLGRRQLSEHDPERMRRVELIVAVAGDDEDWHRLHPAGQQPEDVERRLVRPVQVL